MKTKRRSAASMCPHLTRKRALKRLRKFKKFYNEGKKLYLDEGIRFFPEVLNYAMMKLRRYNRNITYRKTR